jgi:release factor glutamine methyltransferase
MRIGERLRAAAAELPGAEAWLEAELLLAQALGRERSWLYAHGDDPCPPAVEAAFARELARRRDGVPLAHLLGRREFWRLDLAVTEATLIPRPETELLVELALARIPAGAALDVLDLGTGSGAVALAIALERPAARVVAVDASAPALAVARANAQAHGLQRVEFVLSDWFAAIAGRRFAVIVGNPPYIADSDPHLGEGDLRFEPRSALASGADGLEAIRRIVVDARAAALPGCVLLLEHGWTQGGAVRALFAAAGWNGVETARDLEGRDRVTLGVAAA